MTLKTFIKKAVLTLTVLSIFGCVVGLLMQTWRLGDGKGYLGAQITFTFFLFFLLSGFGWIALEWLWDEDEDTP